MQLSKIIAGLQVFARYYDKDGYHADAQHDVLNVYPTDKPLSDEDLKAVVELGWLQEEADFESAAENLRSEYRPDEGWYCFT